MPNPRPASLISLPRIGAACRHERSLINSNISPYLPYEWADKSLPLPLLYPLSRHLHHSKPRMFANKVYLSDLPHKWAAKPFPYPCQDRFPSIFTILRPKCYSINFLISLPTYLINGLPNPSPALIISTFPAPSPFVAKNVRQ